MQVAHDEDAHQNNNSDKAAMVPDLELSWLRSFWESRPRVLLTEYRSQGRFGRVAASSEVRSGETRERDLKRNRRTERTSDSAIRPSLAESQGRSVPATVVMTWHV